MANGRSRDALPDVVRFVLLCSLLAALLVPITLVATEEAAEAQTTHRLTIDLNADEVKVIGDATKPLSIKGDVTWRNRSGRTLSVTSPDDLLDSGPIPDGGSFHASLPVAGRFQWETEVGSGSLQVAGELAGQPGDRALDGIPDLAPPPRDPDDVALHPDLVVRASRSTAIVGFTQSATVQEAQQALGHYWEIVGGLPNTGLIYVQYSLKVTDFRSIDAGLASLRAHPAVEFASYDFMTTTSALPEPSSDAVANKWFWEGPQIAADGKGANWGQELTRVPQAWNLLDAAKLGGASGASRTVVVDSGFADHVDLERLKALQLCSSSIAGLTGGLIGVCTSTGPSDHGNHVSGIIGADFDGHGVNGVDPLSELTGVSWKFTDATGAVRVDGLDGRIPMAMSLLLEAIRDSTVTDVSVVNLSVQMSPPSAQDWWDRHAQSTCGPGANDDSSGTGVCYPSTYDRLIAENVEYGKVARRTIEAFVRELSDSPLFVNSTGNSSNDYCRDKSLTCDADANEPQKGEFLSAETWANIHWDASVGPNPILSVEALSGQTDAGGTITVLPARSRAGLSNLDGDIAAPGWAVSTCGAGANPDTYCFQQGTSQAAPVVSGVAGLLASWDPTLSASELKQLLLTWSVPDTTDGAAARVDAYSPLLSLPDAARSLVDVNDPSVDGNRRLIYASDGSVDSVDTDQASQVGLSTDPDGVVDLRDFRRFRDSWLLRCAIVSEPGCPAPAEISLDGKDDHPKRDLNFDGEVFLGGPAHDQPAPSELSFPRFDFNGDGSISRNDTALVALRADGSPAANPGEAGPMTDLAVLASQWDADSPGTLGYKAGDLDDLLLSGDLTLVADSFAALGATEATVTVVDAGTDEVFDTYTVVVDSPEDAVVTLPTGSTYRLDVQASGPSGGCEISHGPISLSPGQDLRVDLDASLSVAVDPRGLSPDQSARVLASATSCLGDVEGTSVDLTLEPSVSGGAQFSNGSSATSVTVGADGTATVDLTGGSFRDRYRVVAKSQIPIDGTLTSRSASTSFFVGRSHEVELVAVDGSGYAALDDFSNPGVPIGPSVNRDGKVAFGGLPNGGDRYHVYVSEPGDDPSSPTDADDLSGSAVPAGGAVVGEPELNDAGEVAFTSLESKNGAAITRVFRSDGTATELASGTASLTGSSGPYSEVKRPTINAGGRTIFVATKQSGSDLLAEKQGSLVVEGPPTAFARPQLADDGTTVARATVSRDCAAYPGVCGPVVPIILDPIILVGEGLQATRSAIAEGRVDGWGALSVPDISPPGDVIAFAGDRGNKRGLWLSTRGPGGKWQTPVSVAGPAGGAPEISDVEMDRPTVVQVQSGPAGPAGDRVLVALRGVGSATSAPTADSVWVLPIDLVATGDKAAPFLPRPGDPQLVAQVGDIFDGHTIDSIELSDALAAAANPAFADDHWVAFHATTSGGKNLYLRARALAPPAAAGVAGASVDGNSPQGTGPESAWSLVPSSLTTEAEPVTSAAPAAAVDPEIRPIAAFTPDSIAKPDSVAKPDSAAAPDSSQKADTTVNAAAADPKDLEVLPGPHIAAVTVDDDTPTARVPTAVVNRSRAIDGTPSWAVLDEPTGTTDVLDNPVLLEPGAETSVTYPGSGSETLNVGAPVSSGDFANDTHFTVAVGKGDNRPPVATITDSPFLVAPGQPLTLRATASDPDADRMTYSWDLDDDGDFDDGDRPYVNLAAADFQATICGGTCELEKPNPIAFRALDERGLDTVVRSSVTMSGLEDIVVRLEPALTRINPGSTGSLYVVVDAPSGSPTVPVALATEGLPDGWSVSAPDEIDTGESGRITIRVPSDAPEDSFSFDMVATAGDVAKRATVTVVTLFGLIPQCTTTIQGVVTDEGGSPVPFAKVSTSLRSAGTATTDADGHFRIPGSRGGLPTLSKGFEVEQITWTASRENREAPTYLTVRGGPNYVRCEGTLEFNPVLAEVKRTGLTARAVVGIENPINPSRPLATDQPLGGAAFEARYTPNRFPIFDEKSGDAEGRVTFSDIPTQTDSGRDLSVGLSSGKQGYWGTSRSLRLTEADALQTVDVGDMPLVKACSGTFTGGKVVDQFGDPVQDARVRLFSSDPFTKTGPDGMFTLNQEVFLGKFNRPRTVSVNAYAPLEWGNNDRDVATARLASCGASTNRVTLELERPEPDPVEYFGTLLGTVTESGTGDPVAKAVARISNADDGGTIRLSQTSRANGTWGRIKVLLGEDDPTVVRSLEVRFESERHHPKTVEINLAADTEVPVDVVLDPRPLVSLSGVVTDAETGAPIKDARVGTSVGDGSYALEFSEADGRYLLPGLILGPGDTPRTAHVRADFDHLPAGERPYWLVDASTTIIPDGPNTLDLKMVPVCDSFSVSGVVVNAATLEPLSGVKVTAWGAPVLTDAQGRYEIPDIQVERNNAPRKLTVRASKAGFFDATVQVTGFCGADIRVDFGRPSGGFGTVSGTVTEKETGDPLADVFVGSTWGDATTTDKDGKYQFDRAPLTSAGEPREWKITAVSGFRSKEKQVTVSADTEAVADFRFGPEQNLPPIAHGQTVKTEPGEPVVVKLTGNDPENQDVTFSVIDGPGSGKLSGTAPNLTYTPDDNFAGTDEFKFTVNDGTQDSDPATVAIEVVAPVNHAPVIAVPAQANVIASEAVEIAVTANDSDSDALSFSLTDDAAGRAKLNDNGDGTALVTVTTDAADDGKTLEATVSVTDGRASDAGTVKITVTGPINRPPKPKLTLPKEIFEGDEVSFDASGSSDPDGDKLTYGWTLVDFNGDPITTGSGRSMSHTFTDDFVGGIQLLIRDARGEEAFVDRDVVVLNLPPAVTLEPLEPNAVSSTSAGDQSGWSLLTEVQPTAQPVGGSVAVLGSFTDPGRDDTHEVTIDWGDGTSERVAETGGTFGSSHSYAASGDFTVSVQVCDDDGGCSTAARSFNLPEPDADEPPPNDPPADGTPGDEPTHDDAPGDEPTDEGPSGDTPATGPDDSAPPASAEPVAPPSQGSPGSYPATGGSTASTGSDGLVALVLVSLALLVVGTAVLFLARARRLAGHQDRQ